MLTCKDVNDVDLSPGDKIFFIKNSVLVKATMISIGREHFLARVNEDGIMENVPNLICGNKHVIKYDW